MERYTFPYKAKAEIALAWMKQLIEWYGVASRADIKAIQERLLTPEDQRFGWNGLDKAIIESDEIEHQYVLVLPRAVRLD